MPKTQERLRAAIAAATTRHGSKKQLADALGVSQPWISQVLAGDFGVGVEHLPALARFTGRTVDDLLGVSVAPSPVVARHPEENTTNAAIVPSVANPSTDSQTLVELVQSFDVRLRSLENLSRAALPDHLRLTIGRRAAAKRRAARASKKPRSASRKRH
jgi:transcriptional regulator with XRE-family HTH domain